MRTFIIAPDVEVGRHWADEKRIPPSERVYVTDPDRLRGLNNPRILTDNWSWPEAWTQAQIESARTSLTLADRGSMEVIAPPPLDDWPAGDPHRP